MEIVKFKKLKGNLYEIVLDNGLSFKLYDDVIVKYNLLVNKRFDDKFFMVVTSYNDSLDAYYTCIKYLNTKMRSEVELRKYLDKKGISKEVCDKTIDRLKKSGYLNRELYIKSYVADAFNFSNNGPVKIMKSLNALGFSDEEVKPFLDLDFDSKAIKLIDKKLKSNKLSASNFRMHISNYLVNLGYPKEVFSEYLMGVHVNDDGNLEKDYNMLMRKYSKKYSGDKLKYFIKGKLYQKGYSLEKIGEVIDE